eukprot:7085550-Pyramimonas_sp.AAC.1
MDVASVGGVLVQVDAGVADAGGDEHSAQAYEGSQDAAGRRFRGSRRLRRGWIWNGAQRRAAETCSKLPL